MLYSTVLLRNVTPLRWGGDGRGMACWDFSGTETIVCLRQGLLAGNPGGLRLCKELCYWPPGYLERDCEPSGSQAVLAQLWWRTTHQQDASHTLTERAQGHGAPSSGTFPGRTPHDSLVNEHSLKRPPLKPCSISLKRKLKSSHTSHVWQSIFNRLNNLFFIV